MFRHTNVGIPLKYVFADCYMNRVSILPVSDQVYSLKVTILGQCLLCEQQHCLQSSLSISKPKYNISIATLIINIYQRKNQFKMTYGIQM